MKSMRALLCVIALSCLSGCGTRTPPSTTWVKPIYLEPETIEWLERHREDWPESLVDDLNEIDKHNQKVTELGHAPIHQ